MKSPQHFICGRDTICYILVESDDKGWTYQEIARTRQERYSPGRVQMGEDWWLIGKKEKASNLIDLWCHFCYFRWGRRHYRGFQGSNRRV